MRARTACIVPPLGLQTLEDTLKYKSYNEKGSDRKGRKMSRRNVLAYNKELHTKRSKATAKAARAETAAKAASALVEKTLSENKA